MILKGTFPVEKFKSLATPFYFLRYEVVKKKRSTR